MNFIDFCREYNIEFRQFGEHHHTTQGWVSVNCPNCSPNSGNFRLGWNLRGNYFSCWSCGKVPTLATLEALSNQPYRVVKEFVGGLTLRNVYEPQKAGVLKIPNHLDELKKVHRNYLVGRGFNWLDIVNTWEVRGFDWKHPKYAWRLFIPIHVDGEIVSWTTRAISDDVSQRYLTAPSTDEKFPAKQTLYGLSHCKHSIVVVEGPLDVWKIGPGAVATMGISYSRAQMLQASRFLNRYICFDSEPKAQKRAMRLCHELMLFPGTTRNIVLESGKDPGEASEKEVNQLKELLI